MINKEMVEAMEGQILSYKKQIEQLRNDMAHVKSEISVSALQYQIGIREASIADIQRDLNL